MQSTALLVPVAALTVALLSACAGPSHQGDADDLRDDLADLPGVARVSLDYTEPVTLDSGKVDLVVRMAEDADAEEIADVVTTTYAAFSGAHNEEEGDLDVRMGDDVVHLRSFKPEASGDAVESAVAQVIDVLPDGAVRAEINTQRVTRAPHVHTTFATKIDAKSADAVLEALRALQGAHADTRDAGWSVQAGGPTGWKLGSSEGFPDATLFRKLSADLPHGARLRMDDDYTTVMLDEHTSPDAVSRMVGRHLRLLDGTSGGSDKALYSVEHEWEQLALFEGGQCQFGVDRVAVRLKQDYAAGCGRR